jgi:prephenate dehydrogenase
MDLASTKAEIARACERLPARFDPLPAHPMCGKETGGLENAETGLFVGAVFAFTPLPRTSSMARRFGAEIAAAVGATPLWLEPEAHDAHVARTSHVPYLLAAALAAATPAAAARLIGPGFRSTARLAGSDPEMMAGVLLSNRSEVLAALAGAIAELENLAEILADRDNEVLLQALAQARKNYLGLILRQD